ncbi:MAG: hypothetical protein HEEMFOPI_01152 [Holosporales bacterium]
MDSMTKKSIQTVPVGDGGTLSLNHIFPLQGKGQYLQKIEAKAHQQKHVFSLYLDIQPNKLQAIALHDIQGRIYDLTLDEKGLTWSAIPEVAEKIKPDYILADFLLTHLSLNTLKANLKNISIHESYEKNKRIRVLEKDGKELRMIKTESLSNNVWKSVEIHNPQFHYVIKIETVDQ